VNAPLYNTEILRLAASAPFADRLADPMASVEMRSPVCGSRVTVDINVGPDGRVTAIGMLVRACALGQAAASLMATHAIGKTAQDFTDTHAALAAWLAGADAAPSWPGLDVFAPARPHSARHASIQLAFQAAAAAAARAAAPSPEADVA
jgi:NifU-like protein involved in Fe-S cluster formation